MISFNLEDIDGLSFVEEVCWKILEEAVASSKHAMHIMTVSSVRDGLPELRSVVLRKVDAEAKKLYFHTDVRKPMVQDLRSTGRISWLGYDQLVRSQIRLSGTALIHHMDNLSMEQWNKTEHYSRRCYLQETPPGADIDDPSFYGDQSGFDYSKEESEKGYQHFGVVETVVDRMEWYFTHSKGNRKAKFAYENGVLITSTWQAS